MAKTEFMHGDLCVIRCDKNDGDVSDHLCGKVVKFLRNADQATDNARPGQVLVCDQNGNRISL